MVLCFLADECFQLFRVNEEPLVFAERLRRMLCLVIEHFDEKYHDIADNTVMEVPGIDKLD